MSFDWTEERIETLRTLWAEGRSASEIYKVIGAVSRSAVIGKLHRLKVYRDGPAVRGVRRARRTRSNERRAAQQREWNRQRRETERLARENGTWRVKEPKKEKPVTPTKIVDVVAPMSKRLTLLELPLHACRYIEDDSPPWTYCAHDALPGKSWCEAHYAVCVNRVSTSEANRRAASAANWR